MPSPDTVINACDYVAIACGYVERLLAAGAESSIARAMPSYECALWLSNEEMEIMKTGIACSGADALSLRGAVFAIHKGKTTDLQSSESEDQDFKKQMQVKMHNCKSSVVFKCSDLSVAMAIANCMQSIGHCAMFSSSTLYEMRQFTVSLEDKTVTVLVLKYDTESG